MLKRRCPFVGLCGDPDTVVAFASIRNCCNRVEEAEPIRLGYQNSHCFTFNHRQCPVLIDENPVNLPAQIAAIPTRKRAVIIVGSITSIFVVGVTLAFLFGVWQPAGAIDQDSNPGSKTTKPNEVFVVNETPTSDASFGQENSPSTVVDVATTETLLPSETLTAPIATEPEKEKAPTPTQIPPTSVSTSCGPPPGWGIYIVQVGDTLSSIAASQGISISQLQNANCLTSAAVYVGQRLYVPYVVTATFVPVWTATKAATATLVPTNTPIPSITLQSTATEVPPLPTDTPLPIPSNTPVPPPTQPPAPTATPTPISLPITPAP